MSASAVSHSSRWVFRRRPARRQLLLGVVEVGQGARPGQAEGAGDAIDEGQLLDVGQAAGGGQQPFGQLLLLQVVGVGRPAQQLGQQGVGGAQGDVGRPVADQRLGVGGLQAAGGPEGVEHGEGVAAAIGAGGLRVAAEGRAVLGGGEVAAGRARGELRRRACTSSRWAKPPEKHWDISVTTRTPRGSRVSSAASCRTLSDWRGPQRVMWLRRGSRGSSLPWSVT